MGQVNIPINIVYDTQGATPISAVIAALQATEVLVQDAASLLPSLAAGTNVELRSVSIKKLSQESPLREIVVATIWLTSQQALEGAVVDGANQLFGVEVDPKYQSLLTLAVLVVLFYGVGMAKDIVARALAEGPARRKLNALVEDLAGSTGKSQEEVRAILSAKYDRPGPVKSLVKNSVAFFLPSTIEGSRAVLVDEDRIEPDIVGDVPFGGQVESDLDYRKFEPLFGIELSIHAQDIDKGSTGWAAVPSAITDRRLKLRLMDPVVPEQIWGRSKVRGDIVLISELTANGYIPKEIQLTSVIAAE